MTAGDAYLGKLPSWREERVSYRLCRHVASWCHQSDTFPEARLPGPIRFALALAEPLPEVLPADGLVARPFGIGIIGFTQQARTDRRARPELAVLGKEVSQGVHVDAIGVSGSLDHRGQ